MATVTEIEVTATNLAAEGIANSTTRTGTWTNGTPYTSYIKLAMIHATDADLRTCGPQDVTDVFTLVHPILEVGEP